MSLQMISQLIIMQRVLASLLSLKVKDHEDWILAINKVRGCVSLSYTSPFQSDTSVCVRYRKTKWC